MRASRIRNEDYIDLVGLILLRLKPVVKLIPDVVGPSLQPWPRAPPYWTNDAGNTAAKSRSGGCLTRLCARQRQPDLNVLAVLAPDRILSLPFHSCISPTPPSYIHAPPYLTTSPALLIPSRLHSQIRAAQS
jgi:hypothetical protein